MIPLPWSEIRDDTSALVKGQRMSARPHCSRACFSSQKIAPKSEPQLRCGRTYISANNSDAEVCPAMLQSRPTLAHGHSDAKFNLAMLWRNLCPTLDVAEVGPAMP